jgi:hypothetical protein
MGATLKDFWVVAALWVVQVGPGPARAPYGVEGSGFYGFPLAEWLAYGVARTWHVQLGIFWFATAWLATGLFMAAAVSGCDPPYLRVMRSARRSHRPRGVGQSHRLTHRTVRGHTGRRLKSRPDAACLEARCLVHRLQGFHPCRSVQERTKKTWNLWGPAPKI